MNFRRIPPPVLLAVFTLSGAAGLGYQAVWVRTFTAGLGSETPSVLAVLAAVMAGLGLGAWVLDRPVSRSGRPGGWYGGLELVLGVWGACLALLLPAVNEAVAGWIGVEPSPLRQGLICLAVPLVLLLPSTAAMGATLPAMERLVARHAGAGPWVGAVYGVNTLGAATGLLAVVWVLMPASGLRGAALVLAGVNLICGVVILGWSRGEAGVAKPSPRAEPRPAAGTDQQRRALWLGIAGVTGFLSMSFEVLGIRLLSQVLENTVFTYAAVLAVYLLGMSGGALIYQRWARSAARDPVRWLFVMLTGLSVAVAVAMLSLQGSLPLLDACRRAFGSSAWGIAATEISVTSIVFLPPTLLMGGAFSHIAQQLCGPDGGVGRVLGANALAGALAPPVTGLLLLPVLGVRWSLGLTALGYAGSAVWLATASRLFGTDRKLVTGLGAAAGVAALGVTLVSPLRLLDLPPGSVVRRYAEGALGFVAVTEEPDGHRTLRVDNRFQMGGTAALEAQSRQAHVPLLLHPRPRTALFLGAGTGITLGAASFHPALDAEGVELLPEVADAMHEFGAANRLADWPKTWRVRVADARRFVLATPRRYDVIVSDLFHPARDGAGLLYTREHFRAVRQRLTDGGLFCQWLPVHQLDAVSLRMIIRTFLVEFPDSELWWLRFSVDTPVVGLVGYTAQPRHAVDFDDPRWHSRDLGVALGQLGLPDPVRLHGLRIADPETLAAFGVAARLNTDDRPSVLFLAPRVLHESPAAVAHRVRLILALSDTTGARTAAAADADPAVPEARLHRYQQARDRFLHGLLAEFEGREKAAVEAWLDSVRLSADFTPAYARCLARASWLLSTQPAEARALLERLAEAQPGLPVARQMLDRLDTGGPRR